MHSRTLLALLLLTAAVASVVPVVPAEAALPPAPLLLDSAPRCDETAPDVAFLPGGAFVATWVGSRPDALLASSAVYLRLFDRVGQPLGPETMLTGDADLAGRPAVAADADGTILVVWGDMAGRVLRGRLLSRSGVPLGDRFDIAAGFAPGGVDVTAEPGGGFAVVWADADAIFLRRYTAAGQPRGPHEVVIASSSVPEDPPARTYDPAVVPHGNGLAITYVDAYQRVWGDPALAGGNVGLIYWRPGEDLLFSEVGGFTLDTEALDLRLPRPSLAVGADGRVLVAWRAWTPEDGLVLRGRLYTALGEPLGPDFRIDFGTWEDLSGPSVAADGAGNFLVTWLGARGIPQLPGAEAYLRRFGPDGSPLGSAEALSEPFATSESASSPALAVDAVGRALVAWGTGRQLPDGVGAPDVCFSQGLFARLLDPVTPLHLTLQGGRFLAGVRWTDHAGRTGVGRPVPLTGDSGYFWFFDPNNAELVVKVLDGRSVNGHYWVFFGALSDVAYTLEVTDTLTGAVRAYTNPPGRLTSRADTTAFAVPGASSSAVSAPVLSAPTELAFLASSGLTTGKSFPAGPFCVEYTPPSNGLCLGGRFEVAVEWRANGATGIARAARLGNDSGYFWFFGDNNVELLVKVLDGRPINGRFWFFSGALTDVEHWIHVRDSVTGEERIYHNPPGRLASRADTSAF